MTGVCCAASAEASTTKVQVIVLTTTAMGGPAVTLSSSSTMSWPDYRQLQESWTFAISVLYQRGLCSGP